MSTELNKIITPADRELLAQAYEESGYLAGPYPSYAEESREGVGAFTLCSLRAVARARIIAYAEGVEWAAQVAHEAWQDGCPPSEISDVIRSRYIGDKT